MLAVGDPKELMQALSQIDVTVPLRTEGRTKEHTERYAIAYLSALWCQTELAYPLSLVARDRPDFLLSMGERRIGIQHTEAVPRNEAHKSSLRERGHGPNVHFISQAKPGEARKTKKQLIREIEQDDPGNGWVGDFVEREWAEVMALRAEEGCKT